MFPWDDPRLGNLHQVTRLVCEPEPTPLLNGPEFLDSVFLPSAIYRAPLNMDYEFCGSGHKDAGKDKKPKPGRLQCPFCNRGVHIHATSTSPCCSHLIAVYM